MFILSIINIYNITSEIFNLPNMSSANPSQTHLVKPLQSSICISTTKSKKDRKPQKVFCC